MKTIFDKLEEVPEHLREKAVKNEADGTYVLEGDGLLKKNQELLAELAANKKYKDLLKGVATEGMTPEKLRLALEEHEKQGEREAEIQSRIQAAVQQNAQQRQNEIDAANKKVQEMEKSLETQLLERELNTAITNEKGNPLFVAPVLRSRLKVVRDVGTDGVPTYNVRVLGENGKDIALDSTGKPLDVTALVQGAKADKKFSAVFEAPAASGTGTVPGAGTTGTTTGNTAGTGALGLVKDANGIVKISREQAKDGSVYREAVKLAGGSYSNVVIAPEAVTAGATA